MVYAAHTAVQAGSGRPNESSTPSRPLGLTRLTTIGAAVGQDGLGGRAAGMGRRGAGREGQGGESVSKGG